MGEVRSADLEADGLAWNPGSGTLSESFYFSVPWFLHLKSGDRAYFQKADEYFGYLSPGNKPLQNFVA